MTAEVLAENVRAHLAAIRGIAASIPAVLELSVETCGRLERGGTIFTFGNGGSAADAQHLAAELVGRYLRNRRPLAAISLSTDPSVTTCIANDFEYSQVFARQVAALTGPDDLVIAFSTSGTSPSVTNGLKAARITGAMTVLFTGATGTDAAEFADTVFRVHSTATARIQEGHVLLLHLLSEAIDTWASQAIA